jgi:hypothetical protein
MFEQQSLSAVQVWPTREAVPQVPVPVVQLPFLQYMPLQHSSSPWQYVADPEHAGAFPGEKEVTGYSSWQIFFAVSQTPLQQTVESAQPPAEPSQHTW